MAALSLFSAPCGNHQFPFAFRIPYGASAGLISATSADTDSLLPPFCFSPFPPPNSIGKSRFGGHLAAEEKALPPKAHTYFPPQRRKMQSAEGAMGDIEDGHQPNKKNSFLANPKNKTAAEGREYLGGEEGPNGRKHPFHILPSSIPILPFNNSSSSSSIFLVSPRFSFFWSLAVPPHFAPSFPPSNGPLLFHHNIDGKFTYKNGCCPPLL